MSEQKQKPNLFNYLDRVMGKDGIKTSNKIAVSVDTETAFTLLGIGVGLVIFSHIVGAGVRALSKKSSS